MTRARLAHYGGPAALLLAITVGVLLVRHALLAPASPARATAAAAAVHEPPARPKPQRAVRTAVRDGDTLGAIALRFHTTVDRLLALNPGVDPTSLHVGQRLRVK